MFVKIRAKNGRDQLEVFKHMTNARVLGLTVARRELLANQQVYIEIGLCGYQLKKHADGSVMVSFWAGRGREYFSTVDDAMVNMDNLMKNDRFLAAKIVSNRVTCYVHH